MDPKRSRIDNWTKEEKSVFLELIKGSAKILENKCTDTNTNKEKIKEWALIETRFHELTGKRRDIAQIKGLWRRMKISAKKSISEHRRAITKTGGGEKPPLPSQEDLLIYQTIPNDFKIDKNDFDCDSVLFSQNADIFPSTSNTQDTLVSQNTMSDDIIYEPRPSDIPAPGSPCGMSNVILVSQGAITEEEKPRKKIQSKKKKSASDKGLDDFKSRMLRVNTEQKDRMLCLMEKEFTIKKQFLDLFNERELEHQKRKHMLEIEILEMQKKKIEVELK